MIFEVVCCDVCGGEIRRDRQEGPATPLSQQRPAIGLQIDGFVPGGMGSLHKQLFGSRETKELTLCSKQCAISCVTKLSAAIISGDLPGLPVKVGS